VTSLRARITLVTVLVAVVTVVVTALISLQLVRLSTTDGARVQLAAQAELLAKLPRISSAAELSERASVALGGTEVALVSASGSVDGEAASYVTDAILTKLTSGHAVSTTAKGPGGAASVEARPTRAGTAIVLVRPVTSIESALRQSTIRILLSLAIGFAVAILGGTLLARVLSKPLTATATAASRLARGERGVSLPTAGTAEVAAVSDALAALDAALTSSEGRQREFLLSISHELRTPITAVRGYAEALADGLIPPDQLVNVGATLVAETERLDRFVADLLELARLEADDFTISHGRVARPGNYPGRHAGRFGDSCHHRNGCPPPPPGDRRPRRERAPRLARRFDDRTARRRGRRQHSHRGTGWRSWSRHGRPGRGVRPRGSAGALPRHPPGGNGTGTLDRRAPRRTPRRHNCRG
jgi:two-component system OmpR family sensor kinase